MQTRFLKGNSMKIFCDLREPEPIQDPLVVTIGNFDGVHLGHQLVLKKVAEAKDRMNGKSLAITFSNHPSEVLNPEKPLFKICTLNHRIKLLKESGIDILLLLTFTKEFSQQSAEEFLKRIREKYSFSHLILGHDAAFGKDRKGDRQQIQNLAKAFHFHVEYLDSFSLDGVTISSSKIRELISEGDFTKLQKFLGRPYSIYSKVISGKGKGKTIGFPTANIEVNDLCLPPYGVYAVKLINSEQIFKGVANLGVAPTIRHESNPLLEVHLFEHHEDLYNKNVEVIFSNYLRPEKKFSGLEELKNQIHNDIQKAKILLNA